MYAPANYDFDIYAGASFDLTLTWKDENDVVFDLSGYTGLLEIKDQAGGHTFATFSTGNGRIVFDDASPNIVVSMTADDTADLVFSARTHNIGVYNLDITSPGDVTTRLIYGNATLHPDI